MRSDSEWWYMAYVDFPFSILWAAADWGRANIMTVFAILGTLWWYVLSYYFWFVFNKRAAAREAAGQGAVRSSSS